MTTTQSSSQGSMGSKYSDLQQLMQVGFLQEALLQVLGQKKSDAKLLAVNHQDRYLSLSDEHYYIIVIMAVSPVLLAEVQDDLGFIQQRKKIIVNLQQQTDLTELPPYRRVSIEQLRQEAKKKGVSERNPYFYLLEKLFEPDLSFRA